MTWSYRVASVGHDGPPAYWLLDDGVERATIAVIDDDPEALLLRIVNGLDHAPPLAGFGGKGGDMLERRRRKLAQEGRR